VQNSVCLNHPDRPASTRCDVCFKPICGQCAVETHDGTFCSQACLANFGDTQGGVTQWHAQQGRMNARRWRRRMILLIVLCGLGWAAYRYFTRNPDKLDQLKREAGSAVKDVRKRVPR